MSFRALWFTVPAFIGTVGWLCSGSQTVNAKQADRKDAAKPVESDMHEFMEYVFEPTFKRLKPAMAAAPADNKGWKAIKADSLILAEAGNLLLIRQPEKDAADWVKHSAQVRETGGQLYEAAKGKDYAAARKHYQAMIQNCNACHKQFANGEYTLSP
jgi:hypothetical protein